MVTEDDDCCICTATRSGGDDVWNMIFCWNVWFVGPLLSESCYGGCISIRFVRETEDIMDGYLDGLEWNVEWNAGMLPGFRVPAADTALKRSS